MCGCKTDYDWLKEPVWNGVFCLTWWNTLQKSILSKNLSSLQKSIFFKDLFSSKICSLQKSVLFKNLSSQNVCLLPKICPLQKYLLLKNLPSSKICPLQKSVLSSKICLEKCVSCHLAVILLSTAWHCCIVCSHYCIFISRVGSGSSHRSTHATRISSVIG